MRLLFDANVSAKLVERLAEVFPESSHVSLLGLERAGDAAVWAYAIEHGFVIVSKDEDFHQLALLVGPPPKVVWVRLGNCSTDDVERALREGRDAIDEFWRPTRARSLCSGSVAVELADAADRGTVAVDGCFGGLEALTAAQRPSR